MEAFLNNYSFLFLLFSMFFYWIRAFFNINIFYFFAKFTTIAANLSMFCLLLYRSFYENHFPLSNLYEALVFLSWSFTLILLSIENSEFLIGTVIIPTALFLNSFANFQLPDSLKKISPLIPALKSNWLIMHVTITLLSYATLICGCILSIAFIFVYINQSKVISPEQNYFFLKQKNSLLEKLDKLSFRTISMGFPLLTIGILSGSIWANEAWGSYWNWDPKETWSLITWFVFAIYLHLRLTYNWNAFKSAILATFGFFTIWICFLGVNFLAKGLHSYGWF